MNDIDDAIEVAAGYNISRNLGIGQPANASNKAVGIARRIVRSFLENVDDGLTVLELREALDNPGAGEQ